MTAKGKIKATAAIAAAALILFGAFCITGRTFMKIVYPIKYAEYVEKYSREYGIEKNLLYAVIKTESSFNPEAVSRANAAGLTQITPETLEWLQMKLGEEDKKIDLHDPETSIKYGAFFLSYLLEEFECRDTAIAAYHAGRGRVNGWLKDKSLSPDGISLTEIPVSETAHYVKKVNKALNAYNKLYAD